MSTSLDIDLDLGLYKGLSTGLDIGLDLDLDIGLSTRLELGLDNDRFGCMCLFLCASLCFDWMVVFSRTRKLQ